MEISKRQSMADASVESMAPVWTTKITAILLQALDETVGVGLAITCPVSVVKPSV